MIGWKYGLPPGKLYPGMTDDFEVAFAPLAKWHRRRTPRNAWLHASMSAVLNCPSIANLNTVRLRLAILDRGLFSIAAGEKS